MQIGRNLMSRKSIIDTKVAWLHYNWTEIVFLNLKYLIHRYNVEYSSNPSEYIETMKSLNRTTVHASLNHYTMNLNESILIVKNPVIIAKVFMTIPATMA